MRAIASPAASSRSSASSTSLGGACAPVEVLSARLMHGGLPAQAERVGEHQLRLSGEQELEERSGAEHPRAVGAGGVDGPYFVVDAEQYQMHAAEVAFLEAAVAAAVVAPYQDAALELIAPDRVRRGEIAGLRRAGLDGDGGQLHRSRSRRGARLERLGRGEDLFIPRRQPPPRPLPPLSPP